MNGYLPKEKSGEKYFHPSAILMFIFFGTASLTYHYGDANWTIIVLFYSFLLPILYYIHKFADLFVHYMILARSNHDEELKVIQKLLIEINTKIPKDNDKEPDFDEYDID